MASGPSEIATTADEITGRHYCYPIVCAGCDEVLAGEEENGALGRGDLVLFNGNGSIICHNHPEEAAFAAAGVYACGGGAPCDAGRAFRPESVARVADGGPIHE